jgi:SLT domain-containing protein
MARQLGEAFVTIRAETTGFRAEAYAQIKKALAGISPTVPVEMELRKNAADRFVSDLGKFMSKTDVQAIIQANVDARKAYEQIIELRSRLEALSERIADIPIGVDDRAAQARIAALQARLLALVHTVAKVQVGADTSGVIKAAAAVAALEASTDKLAASSARAVAAFLAEGEATSRLAGETVKAAAAMKVETAAIKGEAKAAVEKAATLGTLTVAENLLGIAMGRTPPLITRGNNAMRAFGITGGWFGAIFTVLSARVTLFGGLLNGLLPEFLTNISVWHIAADVLFELIAVWGGAAIAAGAFGIAASDAAQEVVRRMQALHTVADATSQTIPPLTGNLEKLHDAVRPAVYEVFGDALNLAKARTGDFATIVNKTAPVVDYLAARMTVAISNGKAFDVFTKNASDSLLGLGNSFGNVFGAIGNVLTVMPDYAQKLLNFGVVVTRLLENFTAMIQPVLRWGLALHGAFIYVGLAVTLGVAFYSRVLVPMAAALVNAAARAAFFSIQLLNVARAEGIAAAAGALLSRISPLGWIALAVAGLTALVIWLHHSSDATKNFAQNLVDLADAANVTQSLTANLNAQAAITARLRDVQEKLNIVTSKGLQNSFGGAIYYQRLTAQAQVLSGALRTLQQQYQTEQSRLQPLIQTYGSTAAALGVLNAAGITTAQITKDQGQAWAIDKAQIDGTISAYKAMTGVAGQMNNNMEVIGRTVTDQYTAIQKLNQGWSQFISDVTSTQGTFDTVIQGFEVLSSHSGDLKLSLGKLKATFSDAAGSVALQGKLATATAAVASAQNTLNKLQKSGTATNLQLQAAQQRLVGAQDRLTVAQLNLSKAQSGGVAAIDALTPAGIALNQAFTDEIANIDKLLASWRTAGIANELFVQGTKDAIAPLVKYARGSNEATAQLIALAQEAGFHGPNSMKELTKWLGNTKNATADLKAITDQATQQEALLTGAMQSQGKFLASQLIGDINNAILKYEGVRQAAADYGNAIAKSGQQSDAARHARQVLINDLIAAGKAAGDTTETIAAMISQVLHIPLKKAIQIVLETSGQGVIKIVGTGLAARTINTTTGVVHTIGGHTIAKGAYIVHGRGPTVDDFPALLARGEVVVPANMVSAGLVDHLRGRIPGFAVQRVRPDHRVNPMRYASGGLAGFAPSINSSITQVGDYEAKFGQTAVTDFALAAIKAAQAIASSGFLGPGSGNYAADIQTVLKAMGLPLSLTANWLRQIQTESGGNLRAVNLTDSNAQAGHPSVGLLQLIPGTFAAYAGPYINTPPLVNFGGGPVSEDPMAQIYAAIHYAAARYGGAAMAGVIGQGHGYKRGGLVGSTYDKGGILPPWKVGVNTSGHAEMVSPATGPGSLHETNMLLRMMIHAVNENTRVTGTQGHQFAHGLGITAARGASRGYYGG